MPAVTLTWLNRQLCPVNQNDCLTAPILATIHDNFPDALNENDFFEVLKCCLTNYLKDDEKKKSLQKFIDALYLLHCTNQHLSTLEQQYYEKLCNTVEMYNAFLKSHSNLLPESNKKIKNLEAIDHRQNPQLILNIALFAISLLASNLLVLTFLAAAGPMIFLPLILFSAGLMLLGTLPFITSLFKINKWEQKHQEACFHKKIYDDCESARHYISQPEIQSMEQHIFHIQTLQNSFGSMLEEFTEGELCLIEAGLKGLHHSSEDIRQEYEKQLKVQMRCWTEIQAKPRDLLRQHSLYKQKIPQPVPETVSNKEVSQTHFHL